MNSGPCWTSWEQQGASDSRIGCSCGGCCASCAGQLPIYTSGDWEAYYNTPDGQRQFWWWAEWILLFAYVPIVAMFVGLVYSWYADSKVADSSGSGSEFDAETAHVEELSITGDDVSVYTMCKNGSVISASPGGRRRRVLSVGSRSRSSNERDGNGTDMAAIGRSLVNPLQSGQKDLRSSSPLQSPRSPHEEL